MIDVAPTAIDLGRPISIHLVGIGGAGMSAIAVILLEMGHDVSGSDLKDSPALDRLRALGATITIGHHPDHVAGALLVAISSAIGATNPEVHAAHAAGVPVVSRADLLAAIAALRRTVAISGTHGKTTTTSMLALILLEAGLRPSFLIGGEVNEIGTNAAWSDGELFVVEADESDGTFLRLGAELAIVTSVDADHLEYYGSLEALTAAFSRFASDAARAIVCVDDERARLLAPPGAVGYGFAPDAEFRISAFVGGRSEIAFELSRGPGRLQGFSVPVPGAHNARNAAAAVAAATLLGVPPDVARRALERFTGVDRRFQFRGEAAGVSFVDDYAHLPAEVAATLAAARDGGWRRVVAVFQPHRYSRTESVGAEFKDAFVDADLVVITSIDAAGEVPRPGISAKIVLDALLAAHPETAAAYLPQRDELVSYLAAVLRPGDCCMSLGAGNLTSLADELVARMSS